MHPVCELDDDDPDILCHGHQHFPQVLCLLLLPGGIGDLGQLGHPVDKQGHLFAKGLLDLLNRAIGVLHHIVEKSGHNGLGIHTQAHQDGRHRQGVDDVGLAGAALLVLVLLLRQAVGLLNLGPVVLFAAFLYDLSQLLIAADLHHNCHCCSLLYPSVSFLPAVWPARKPGRRRYPLYLGWAAAPQSCAAPRPAKQ